MICQNSHLGNNQYIYSISALDDYATLRKLHYRVSVKIGNNTVQHIWLILPFILSYLAEGNLVHTEK